MSNFVFSIEIYKVFGGRILSLHHAPNQDTYSHTIERLRWQIDRCENWVNNADTKATVILGLNGALVAGVLSIDKVIVTDFLARNFWCKLLAGLFGLSVFFSSVMASSSILPNLGKAKSGGSVFHFLDVSLMNFDQFRAASDEMNLWDENCALNHQVFTVSCIVARKYCFLRWSVGSLMLALALGLAIIFTHDFLLGG